MDNIKNMEWLRHSLQKHNNRLSLVLNRVCADGSDSVNVTANECDLAELDQLKAALHDLNQATREIEGMVSSENNSNVVALGAEVLNKSVFNSSRQATTKSAQPGKRQKLVNADELTLAVTHLFELFQAGSEYDSVNHSDWVSQSGRTRVVRSGNSAFATRTLDQNPDALFAEYVVYHNDREVFTYQDYVWPDLATENTLQQDCSLPTDCLEDLVSFHAQHNSWWYAEYCRRHGSSTDQYNADGVDFQISPDTAIVL